MASNSRIDWNALTDTLLVTLKQSHAKDQKHLTALHSEAAKIQRERRLGHLKPASKKPEKPAVPAVVLPQARRKYGAPRV